MTATQQWPCASGASLGTTPVLPRGLRLAQRSKDFLYLCFPVILFFQGRVNNTSLTAKQIKLEKGIQLNKKKLQVLVQQMKFGGSYCKCWHTAWNAQFHIDTDMCLNYL